MKISIFNRKDLKGIAWLFVLVLFAGAILMITTSYYHNSEINLLLTGCYKNGGEAILEIHNNLTGSYSFECKPK